MRRLHERKRRLAVICLAGGMLVSLTGCSSSAKFASGMTEDSVARVENTSVMDMGGSYLTEESKWEETMTAEEASVEVDDNAASVQSNRKLIKTVDMDVETREFDKVMSSLEEQISALGGYIENMDTYNGSSYSYYRSTRSAGMTIRIPKDKLDGFLETVSEISNVVRRSEKVEDVTLAYVDLESHKNALRTEQTRLLELLEKAESIEDILTIEQRLSEVRYALESMESQLRTYDNKVDYSTVYLSVEEVKELTPVAEETVGERIVNGFKESLRDIGEGIQEFGIWFVVHIPYMVVWGIILVAAVVVIKKLRRRRRERKVKNVVGTAGEEKPTQPQK